ncbi:MAG: RagB/SusD family nutrient uptake outer membrane protein [Bacteroidales bacterium]|nr:RagB/SusD family nutrient uptake outer membrane protein [Bacteroidales bacterium]
MKKTLGYIITLLVAVSCNLEQFPTNAVVYEEGSRIIATRDDLLAFEAGIMNFYRAVHGGGMNVAEDVMFDAFNASSGFGNNYGSVHRLDDSFTTSDSYVESYWSNHYIVIKNYNVLIDALDQEQNVPSGSEDLAKLVQGEAYFYRAEAYLNLVRHFSPDYDPDVDSEYGVPVVLHYSLDERPARKSVHEVYTQIKEDLDSAAVRLAKVEGQLQSDYPTIDAVNALYARYYLDIEDFDNAAASADAVISTNTYALSKDATAFKAEFVDDSGSEAIMQLYGSKAELPNSITAYTGLYSSLDHGVAARPLFIPTKKLVDAYGSTDLRKAWLSTTDYYCDINGNYYRGDFSIFVKYLGNPALYSNIPNGAQMEKPYMIAEMYLIKAEAQARSNKIPAAKTTLNVLQALRGATTTTGTLKNIQNEWFRETVGDGMRLSCLKRWHIGHDAREGQPGALSVNAIMTGEPYNLRSMAEDDYHLIWPAPASQIRLNSNLTQYPAYTNE